MELAIVVARADMNKSGYWLLQVELEQRTYEDVPQTLKKKLRSDCLRGNALEFDKNQFRFGISLANKITVRFGMLEVVRGKEPLGTDFDPSRVKCQGVASLTMTQHLLSRLRDNEVITKEVKLLHPDNRTEVGRLSFKFNITADGTEEKIIENTRRLDHIKFDVYETNSTVIVEKMQQVEASLVKKGQELQDWIREVDYMNNAVRSLGVDAAVLKKEKAQLERENQELKHKLHKFQNVDDIHIKFDILSTSDQGIFLLKQELEKLNVRLKVERLIYSQLSEEWETIEGKERKLTALKTELEEVKEAQRRMHFEMLLLHDRHPEIQQLRNTIRLLNLMISQYETELSQLNRVRDRGIAAQLEEFRHRQVILNEKHKQVQLLLEENNGVVPDEELEAIRKLEDDQNSTEIYQLKDRTKQLLAEIEELSSKLSGDYAPNSGSIDAIELQVKLEAAEARVHAIQERMDLQAVEQAKVVSEYVSKLSECEGFINSRKRRYPRK